MATQQEEGSASKSTTSQPMAKIMSVSYYRRAESRFDAEPVCRHCNEIIQIGQRYYSPRTKSHGRRYHWACAEKLNIV